MEVPPDVSLEILAKFRVTSPEFVDETSIATIWSVRRHNGEQAALKIYKDKNMGNERCGFTFLEALDGRGAAEVYEQLDGVVLLEWLKGPSLGDLSRSGQDEKANIELVRVANTIHQQKASLSVDYPDLADWFESLFQLTISPDCKSGFRHDIEQSQALARHLLSTTTDVRPLHGDLHHDNIRLGNRGYCAFDAKGVLGERTYELANAFRNPNGVAALVRDPKRIRHLAKSWSQIFRVNEQRLLQWATVKCALSISWRNTEIREDDEADLLGVFMRELKQG